MAFFVLCCKSETLPSYTDSYLLVNETNLFHFHVEITLFVKKFPWVIYIPDTIVQPLTNQRSSSAIPCQNTHFVVRRWNTLLHRLNLIWTPKMEWVPVPVSDILYLQIQSYVQCFNCSVYLFYFSCFKGHKIISICILHYISIKIIYYSQLINFKKWKFGLYCIML